MNCAYQLAFSLFMALVDTIWEVHEYFSKETWTKVFGKISLLADGFNSVALSTST